MFFQRQISETEYRARRIMFRAAIAFAAAASAAAFAPASVLPRAAQRKCQYLEIPNTLKWPESADSRCFG